MTNLAEEIIKELYLPVLREQLNRESVLPGFPPMNYPPVPGWKRRLNRIRYWWSDNVTWRFARHNPLDDHECW